MKNYLLFVFSFFAFGLAAQSVPIIDALAQKDSTTGAVVNVVQSSQISYLLNKKAESTVDINTLKNGWCVQVFSENSQSARDNALSIEKKIRTKFPDETVRTERISPFWRVRVGKFVTSNDAQPLKDLLLKTFPELKGSVYVVKFSE